MKSYLILLLSIILAGCTFHEEYSNKRKQAYKTIAEVVNELNHLYQLNPVGIGESANENYYTLIELDFYLYHKLSKDEGRKILIESTKILLDKINSNVELNQYLQPFPFTEKNVKLAIFVFEDGKQPYYPEICVFSCKKGKITYSTETPETKFGYYTTEEESFEEALAIVKSQQTNHRN